MSSQKPIKRDLEHNETTPLSEPVDLRRWAQLIANGELPFPTHLSASEFDRLAVEVSRLRRTRLIRYIARAIASDFERSEKLSTKDAEHVEYDD